MKEQCSMKIASPLIKRSIAGKKCLNDEQTYTHKDMRLKRLPGS